jgi:hypothetical protein
MLKLQPIIDTDLERIRDWVQADPFHKDDPKNQAEFLLTGNGLLTFCLVDDVGPLCYVKLDAEGDLVRLATQFGPESEVSKRRLIVGMLKMGIPAVINFAKSKGYKGIVFESISPTLISFMSKQGFKAADGNDYALAFGENADV